MSVPAGSSRSPAEEALDRMEERAAGSGISDEDVATVRERLERLTEERDENFAAFMDEREKAVTAEQKLKAAIETAERLHNNGMKHLSRADRAEAEVSRLTAELQHTREGLRRAVYLGEHLHQMIPREVWRDHGAEWMGQYEGDYHAEQVRDELASLALLAGSSVARTEAQAENALLTGLLDKDGQPIRNAARALLRATDNAERNAALGDLYNLLVTTSPSVARTPGDTGAGVSPLDNPECGDPMWRDEPLPLFGGGAK